MVILEAEQEEATALVVVPEAAAGGQGLLRGGFGFDLDRAVYTAVKVQRVSGGGSRASWQILPEPVPQLPVVVPKPRPGVGPPRLPAPKPVPPSPPPAPPAPVVKPGTALKPVFEYCPYGYYGGPVPALSKGLCQESWAQWYKKQWNNRLVHGQILRATNTIAQQSYNVVYAWDRKRGIDLIAAGFKGLSSTQLQTMLDLAAAKVQEAQPQLPPEILQRWEQASSLINTITPAEFGGWFDALSQAIEQGRFDEEYSRLLSQGLERLQNALLILMNSQDTRRAKELLRKAAQVWARLAQVSPEVGEAIKERMRDVRLRLESNFLLLIAACDLVPGVCTILQIEGLGTVVVAGNSVGQGGWVYKGLRLDRDGSYTQQGLGDWWGAVLLLPKEKNPMGRSIVAVSRGDHCVDCGAKADEISTWVKRAVELAPSVQKDNGGDLGVVTFAFTNPNANVASVLQRLRQDHQDSQVPVIVALDGEWSSSV